MTLPEFLVNGQAVKNEALMQMMTLPEFLVVQNIIKTKLARVARVFEMMVEQERAGFADIQEPELKDIAPKVTEEAARKLLIAINDRLLKTQDLKSPEMLDKDV